MKPDLVEERGQYYARSIPVLAGLLGVHRATIMAWRRRGAPAKTGHGYPVAETIVWARTDGPWRPEEDLDGEGETTESLERLRTARARLAEMDIAEREADLVRAGDLREILLRAASRIREGGENLGRKFGPDAQRVLDEAVEAAEGLIGEALGDEATE